MATSITSPTIGSNPLDINQALASGGLTIDTNKLPGTTLSQGNTGLTTKKPTPVPTPVVSSNTAAKKIQTTINTALNNQNTSIANSQAEQQRLKELDATTQSSDKFLKGTGKVNPNYVPQQTGNPPVEKTPEQLLAEQPAPGMQKVFNVRTGQSEEIPVGAIPQGHSNQDPKTRTDVADTITDSLGNTIKKFSDGTYARIDIDGNYTMGTSQMFDDAKRIDDFSKQLDNARKGIYNENQQSQLDSLKRDYEDLMKKQTIHDNNVTGGTTISMARSGLGNQIIGQQQIQKTVQDGLDNIARLTSQRDGAISKMKMAFEQDDMNMLKSAYDLYAQSSASIQKQIDQTQLSVQTQQNKLELKNQDFATKMFNQYGGTMDNPILITDTPDEVMKKVKESKGYINQQNVKAGIVSQAVVDTLLDEYEKTGSVPNAVARNKDLAYAFYAARDGVPNIVGNAIENKVLINAANKTIAKEEQKTAALNQAKLNFDSSIKRLKDYMNSETGYGPGQVSPLINQATQYLQGKVGLAPEIDKAKLSQFQQALDSTVEEYARISSGGFQSVAATTASARKRAADLLDAASTKGQFLGVVNVMEKEVQGLDQSYKENLATQKGYLKDLLSNKNGTTTLGGGSNTQSGTGGLYDF